MIPQGRNFARIRAASAGLWQRLENNACKRWPQLDRVRRGLKNSVILNGRLGDQDNAVLSYQDTVSLPSVSTELSSRSLSPSERFGGRASEYVLETHADEFVSRFDDWLVDRGGGPFGFTEGSSSKPWTEAELMDRWTAHTRLCPDSRFTLNFISRISVALQRGIPISLVFAALFAVFGFTRLAAVPLLGTALCYVAVGRLRQTSRGFLSALPEAPDAPVRTLWDA